MKFALKTLSACSEPAAMICKREEFMISRTNLKQLPIEEMIQGVLANITAFCTSFGRSLSDEDQSEAAAFAAKDSSFSNETFRMAIDFKAGQLFFNLVK